MASVIVGIILLATGVVLVVAAVVSLRGGVVRYTPPPVSPAQQANEVGAARYAAGRPRVAQARFARRRTQAPPTEIEE